MKFAIHEEPEWDDLRTTNVLQGEFQLSSDVNTSLSTILGSCISVALFDRCAGVGGMNHYLLPTSEAAGKRELKFGAMANELLLNELLKSGASRTHLCAKIFGGANIVASLGDIGSRNAQFAKDYLRWENIPIQACDVGGSKARRVQFHPSTGLTRVFKVPTGAELGIVSSERAGIRERVTSEVTLF